jgi:hypothetical protein
MNTVDAAKRYTKLGWKVFPVARKGKTPLTKNGCKDATISWEIFEEDFSFGSNIGVGTGSSSGLVVLDVDPKNDGLVSLNTLVAENGPLPATVCVSTGGNGLHYYFKHPGGKIPNSVGRLGRGLDVRADGGYVVAPPSVHDSGKLYSFQNWAPLSPPPDWLLNRILVQRVARSADDWSDFINNGAKEGGRNQAMATLAGLLLRTGTSYEVCLGLSLAWNDSRCVPPLPEEEVERTVASIFDAEEARKHRG